MKIVIDCAHGATYQVAPTVFAELGATVDRDRRRSRRPEHQPTASAPRIPEALMAHVRETGADLGIAFDGDGDRVLMVDARRAPCSTATT